jgi:NADH-quinone oxidoreductase subunit L
MIVRMNFLFVLTPETMVLVSAIGGLTALFAATIALTQRDIKKVLAYSTVSQLGYMFVAVGVGAFTAGIFHLVTHAFFKALLFLGSGSVIHGMHEEQDIMKMGGLRKYMPKTFATFAIGTAAIAGFPLLSGFFSKDEILHAALTRHMGAAGPVLWVGATLTALLTAFYMMRLTCLTFLGGERFDHHDKHPHESPAVMVVPLVILAGLSVIGGYIGFPGHSWLSEWLSPVVGAHHEEHDSMAWIVMAVSTLVAFAGLGAGYWLYVIRPELAKSARESLRPAYNLLFNKYYVDELYETILVRPVHGLATAAWKYFDVIVVDGAVLAVARVSRFTGEVARLMQTGAIQVYAAFIILGLAATVGYLIYGINH